MYTMSIYNVHDVYPQCYDADLYNYNCMVPSMTTMPLCLYAYDYIVSLSLLFHDVLINLAIAIFPVTRMMHLLN